MSKEYSISDILEIQKSYIPYYADTFQDIEDPNIEWPHRHSFYSVVWFTQGTGFYVIDFEEYNIIPGRMFLVNPKQIHNWNYSDDCRGYILMIDSSFTTTLSLDSSCPYIDICERNEILFQHVFENLISQTQTVNKCENNIKIAIEYISSQIQSIAKQNFNDYTQNSPILDNFKRLILENYNKNCSIKDYSDILKISLDELNDLFKKHKGISAKQYLLDLKITEAKRLLLYNNLNITEISDQLGFEDSSYFARIFKKKTSFSPSSFQKKYRK